jgi:hypothetical protein
MSKGGGKTQEVKQDNSPWIHAQPHLMDIMGRGQQLSMGSGISPQTSSFMDRISGRAMAGSPLVDAASAQTQKTIDGGFLNPYASGAMGDAMDMARSKINAQFAGDNNASSAHKEWLGRGITQASLPFASQLFENERGRQMQASAMAPTLANQDFADLGQGLQMGQMRDAAAWNQLFNYQKAVAGSQAGTGSSVTQQPIHSNPWGSAAGGAMAGYAIGGPWGAAIGGGLGLLGGR